MGSESIAYSAFGNFYASRNFLDFELSQKKKKPIHFSGRDHGQKLGTVWPLSMRITDLNDLYKCLTLIRICMAREKFLIITLKRKGISHLRTLVCYCGRMRLLCAKF